MSLAEDRAVLAGAMPVCGRDGCEQPWQRVEIHHGRDDDGEWRAVAATAVCEYGHRTRIEADDA